jgi:Na+/H+-dicarboxylate symporter
VNKRPRVPQAVRVIACLAAGVGLGLAFPTNRVVLAIAESGTWFPKTIVTFATAIIFILMSSALAKTLLSHKRATRFLAVIVSLYVVMGAVSLVYVSAWIPVLTGLPFTRADVPLPGVLAWLHGIAMALATTFTEQPLLQTLVVGTIVGTLAGAVTALRPAAYALIRCGDWILAAFAKLLWYYPIMIGCLAIAVPARFGVQGLNVYGRTSLNLAVVTIVWSAVMLLVTLAITKRTWSQLWTYFATVWVTGFGTGGSYDTLPVNLISAERDLGLRPQVARASIVLGTVLNKNCATMGVLIVTVSTCALLKIPISMTEIAVLIPPVMILGLESPGIPGGAGMFMSPVVATLLSVPDPTRFVTVFLTFYTGLVPMLATAGNTTDDGFVGAIVNDWFMGDGDGEEDGMTPFAVPALVPKAAPLRAVGAVLSAAGLWMLVAEQARLGLQALRWMSRTTFPGEALAGAVVLLVGLSLVFGDRRG